MSTARIALEKIATTERENGWRDMTETFRHIARAALVEIDAEEEAERLTPLAQADAVMNRLIGGGILIRESSVGEFDMLTLTLEHHDCEDCNEIGAAILMAAAEHQKGDSQVARGLLDIAATHLGQPYRCAACFRPEDECSLNPCAAVIEDREDVLCECGRDEQACATYYGAEQHRDGTH